MNPYLKFVQKILKNHFKIDQTTLKWFAKYKITQTTQVENLSKAKGYLKKVPNIQEVF